MPRISTAKPRWVLVCLVGACSVGAPPKANAQGRGTVVIQGEFPGAEIFVDAKPVGRLPLAPLRLPAGEHTIRATLPGFTEFADVVLVRRGRTTRVQVDLLAVSMLLKVTSDPPGARVFVDGHFEGQTPTEVDLLEGQHSVRVHAPRYRDVIRQVQASPGTAIDMHISMELIPWTAPPAALALRSPSWYEKPITWIGIGGGAVAITTAVVLAVVLTRGGDSAADGFCGSPAGCVRLQPGN